MMNDYDKRLEATYGGDNDYFLLKNGNILEVESDEWSWSSFKTFDDGRGIADDFDDLYDQMDDDTYCLVYEPISERALDHFIKENEGKFQAVNAEIPGAPNVWRLYDKETGACLVSDDIYTDEQDALRDVMSVYFAQEVAKTSVSRSALGYYDGHSELKQLLNYCKEKNIDISDVLEYREVESCITQGVSAIAFVHSCHGEPSELIDGVARELQAYLDNEIYRATEYTIDGEEVDNCNCIVGDNVEMNGIEDFFDTVVEKLGKYDSLEACLEDNQEKLGIEIEPVKPLQDRIKRSGLDR